MLTTDKNGGISLTRGDSARLDIVIMLDDDHERYQMKESDYLYFTVRTSTKNPVKAIFKTSSGISRITLLPTDTEFLSCGKYVYDIQLITGEGDVYTIIPPSVFELMPEVTWDEPEVSE